LAAIETLRCVTPLARAPALTAPVPLLVVPLLVLVRAPALTLAVLSETRVLMETR
jgi:hypothetical protein